MEEKFHHSIIAERTIKKVSIFKEFCLIYWSVSM